MITSQWKTIGDKVKLSKKKYLLKKSLNKIFATYIYNFM